MKNMTDHQKRKWALTTCLLLILGFNVSHHHFEAEEKTDMASALDPNVIVAPRPTTTTKTVPAPTVAQASKLTPAQQVAAINPDNREFTIGWKGDVYQIRAVKDKTDADTVQLQYSKRLEGQSNCLECLATPTLKANFNDVTSIKQALVAYLEEKDKPAKVEEKKVEKDKPTKEDKDKLAKEKKDAEIKEAFTKAKDDCSDLKVSSRDSFYSSISSMGRGSFGRSMYDSADTQTYLQCRTEGFMDVLDTYEGDITKQKALQYFSTEIRPELRRALMTSNMQDRKGAFDSLAQLEGLGSEKFNLIREATLRSAAESMAYKYQRDFQSNPNDVRFQYENMNQALRRGLNEGVMQGAIPSSIALGLLKDVWTMPLQDIMAGKALTLPALPNWSELSNYQSVVSDRYFLRESDDRYYDRNNINGQPVTVLNGGRGVAPTRFGTAPMFNGRIQQRGTPMGGRIAAPQSQSIF